MQNSFLAFRSPGPGFRIAIVGSRKFEFLQIVKTVCEELGPFTLVSGGAKGPDREAQEAVEKLNYPKPEIYIPDWKKKGHAAGFDRNTTIVERGEITIAFWDSKSNGTKDSMKKTYRAGKFLTIVEFSPALKIRVFNEEAFRRKHEGYCLDSWPGQCGVRETEEPSTETPENKI